MLLRDLQTCGRPVLTDRAPTARRPPRIFISYRRSDTLAVTGRIYDRLSGRFGADFVFMDFDNIPIGVDFRTHLNESLQDCDVLLVVIGNDWLQDQNAGPLSRLHDPADFVRLELQVALERDIPVVPVLVGNAAMPDVDALPEDLQPLVYRQAATVDVGRDFHVHMDRLMSALAALGPANAGLDGDVEKALEAVGDSQVRPHATDAATGEGAPVGETTAAGFPRSVLSFAHAPAPLALVSWSVVGIATGSALTLLFDSDLGLALLLLAVPSFALCAVERWAAGGAVGQRNQVLVYGGLFLGGVASPILLTGLAWADAQPLGLWGALYGALTTTLLVALMLLLTAIGEGRWRWGGLVVGVGSVLGGVAGVFFTSQGFIFMDLDWPFWPVWWAGTLPALASFPLLTELQPEAAGQTLTPSHSPADGPEISTYRGKRA